MQHSRRGLNPLLPLPWAPFETLSAYLTIPALLPRWATAFMEMIAAASDEQPPPTLAKLHAGELPDEELEQDDGDEGKVLAT